jgi:ATP-dependent protease Clp ATPase subunit
MAQAQQAGQPNRQYPKKPGRNKFAHTADTKFGMGDNYGTGIRQKLGKVIEGSGMKVITPKKLKKPPRSLA